jgi:phosphoglucomutase
MPLEKALRAPTTHRYNHASGNGAPIGGIKVIAERGWFAARPTGTENIYKIYAESFRGAEHLRRILEEAQTIVTNALDGKKRVNHHY